MNKSLFTFLVVCTFLGSLNGATLLSENFDELTAQLGVTSAGAFTTTGGTNVDIVGPGDGFGALCAAPESGNCVDLDGSGGNPQGVLQSSSLTLMPGITYSLSYDLIGSGRGNTTSATVTFGSYSQTFTLASGDTTSGIVSGALITVSLPTTTELVFTSNTPGQAGSVLDNVLITSLAEGSSVPEPASILLIGSALAFGIAIRGRGFRRQVSNS